jgi:hypothetical protein
MCADNIQKQQLYIKYYKINNSLVIILFKTICLEDDILFKQHKHPFCLISNTLPSSVVYLPTCLPRFIELIAP